MAQYLMDPQHRARVQWLVQRGACPEQLAEEYAALEAALALQGRESERTALAALRHDLRSGAIWRRAMAQTRD